MVIGNNQPLVDQLPYFTEVCEIARGHGDLPPMRTARMMCRSLGAAARSSQLRKPVRPQGLPQRGPPWGARLNVRASTAQTQTSDAYRSHEAPLRGAVNCVNLRT